MQREIKFRAWVTDYDPDHNNHYMMINFNVFNNLKESLHDDEHSKVMQYTGLKDKNGVEIYEGDIIKDVDNRAHTVIYERGMFGCYKTWLVSYETGERRKSIESLNNFLVDEAIVIGNIYENPELLEVK